MSYVSFALVTLLRQMQLVSKIIFGYDAATH